VGPFLVPRARTGGNRVCAARLADSEDDGASVTEAQIRAVAEAQGAMGEAPLFMVFDWQAPLDARLEHEGYGLRDATDMLLAPVADIAAPPPPVSCFEIWPPLAMTEDIWAEGGIGPDRLAVMHAARGPKTSLFGRIDDRPAGAAFVAIDPPVAMLHALEVTPRARRKGLARLMMRAAAHWAAGQGARDFAVLVTRANAPAQALYALLGLRAVGRYHYRTKPKAEA
jgi:GNAT superfamily N-acetyltransferase